MNATIDNSTLNDTTDPYYEAEDTFWNEYQPHFESLDFRFYRCLLASPLVEELSIQKRSFYLLKVA